MATEVITSGSTYKKIENERQDQRDSSIIKIGAGAGFAFVASKAFATDPVQNVAQRIFKLNTTNAYFKYNGVQYADLKIKPRITLGDLALDFAKVLEEISPLKILRTFHVSSFISPYTIPKANLNTVRLTSDQMLLDEIYFRSLIRSSNSKASAGAINDLFSTGAEFREGKLYSISGELILENARLVKLAPSPIDGPDSTHPFMNRVYEKFRNIHGVKDDTSFFKAALSPKGGIGIISGKTELEMATNWARAYGRLAIEPGFKLFDRPLDMLAEVIDKTGLEQRFNLPTNIREKLYLGAGAGGDYSQSVPRMFAKMGGSIAKLTLAGAVAYTAIDQASKALATEDSAYNKGIIEGLATSYVNTRIGIASAWSDNFQTYKERQEQAAPGSTSLLTLAGFPLAGALLGANIGYFRRIGEATVNGVAAADVVAHTEAEGKVLNSLLSKNAGSGPKLTRVGRYAAVGALLAAIPILPFLPGALIGESSEQLKAKYSGEEDVAIRSTRFWGSGGVEWAGGKIKYFTKSWYAQLMNNAEDIGKYGNEETKDRLNPLLHPFDYLRNPYQLEELNQDKSPYPVWGMEVSYGGVFGKLYQATIGGIIKPDIVNKRLDDYIEGGNINGEEGVDIKQKVKDSEASLIEEGLMLAPESAKLTTETELLHTGYSALTDFAGLKGWVASLASDATHTGFGDPGLQLDRSGAMNNAARSILESNLGGMGPAGESLRRFIPTNAGSILDRANPLRNQMPEWMPHDIDNYYIDFSTGDPYQKVEKGYFRLPGEGYVSQHEELKGINPEDYPFIHRFKILSDVAMGSDEYYKYKDIMDARAANDNLTDYEKSIYEQTVSQNYERSIQKNFYKPSEGLVGSYWDKITSAVEMPTESLTFLRPGAKLVHKRTAMEDYVATQVEGTDTGMWTKPYEHFIKPAITKSLLTDNIPQEVLEKRATDEYFDKLQYIKYRNLYKEALKAGDGALANKYKNTYSSTVTGSLASGLDENMELTRAYISLPAQEKAYFAAFSGATSEEERANILAIESTPIAQLYSKIWQRRDVITKNPEDFEAQKRAVADIVESERQDLKLSNPGLYASYTATGASKHSSFEEYVADAEAEKYIKATTGMPDKDFAGWDPRIDLKDIKLRTLSLGNEDVRSYGFWQSDEERLRRLTVVQQEKQVTTQLEEIKSGIREEKLRSAMIKADLYKRGIDVDSIEFHRSKNDDINIMMRA